MSVHKIIFIFTGLLLLINVPILAQTDLPAEQVEVIKNFEAQLEETEKIRINPELPQIDTTTKTQIYKIPQKDLTVEYPAPKIRPIAMKREKLPEAYNAYLRAGAGLPSAFYGEGSFSKFQNKKFDVGLDIKAHGANFKGDDIENQKYREVGVGARGTYYFDEGFAVNGHIGYLSDKIHLYGYNFDPASDSIKGIPDQRVRQQYNTFHFGANIFNGEQTNGDINYSAGFDYYNLANTYAAKENGFDFRLKGTKWVSGSHSIDLGIKADFTSFKDTTIEAQTLNNFGLMPSFTYHGDIFKAKLGINLVSHKDDFTFFPDAEVSVNVAGSQLGAFIGANGDLQKNTFQSLSDYNPYVSFRSPSLTLENTRVFHYYGGIQGNLKTFEYRVQAGFKTTDNLALFVLDSVPFDPIHRTFAVVYDDVDIFSIGGSITAEIVNGLKLLGSVNVNTYTPSKEEKAWHLPTLEVNGGLSYVTLEDKLFLKAQVFVENGVPFKSETGEKDNLNGLFDLSLSAEYFLMENIGFFLEINNLLDNKRQRWRYYPTYGINVMVGASARF